MFDRIQIVLCETTHPGNIGAAARAIKTMGLHRLALVSPNQFPSAEATARASGADDILAQATIHQNLFEAVKGCGLVVGASARLRHIPLEQFDARQAGRALLDAAAKHEVALVFGPERSGLSNDQIGLCHSLVHIPTDPDYPSLNLGSAVQVLCYELRMAGVERMAIPVARMPTHDPATVAHIEGMLQHMYATLCEIDFLDARQSATMMMRLRRFVYRAQPSEREIHILRGILSAAQRLTKQ